MSLTYSIINKSALPEGGFLLKISRTIPIGKQETVHALKGEESDRQVLNSLSKEPPLHENGTLVFKIAGLNGFKLLKLLAATGRLFFADRPLICDFFTPVEFFYLVEAPLSLRGKLKMKQEEFDIRSCDFVAGGPPHLFIRGSFLRFISTEISWKALQKTLADQSAEWVTHFLAEPQEEDGPRVVVQDAVNLHAAAPSPFPCLVLKDRLGSFADLWIEYGDMRLPFASDEAQTSIKRDAAAEKFWEKDLLETDFQLKRVGTSHYYCPLDKVPKSLGFLLELGWKVIDFQGHRVIPQTDLSLELQTGKNEILVKGKVKFADYEANIADVVGAFNRRDRFVSIGSGVVGMLPQSLEKQCLEDLAEEGEIVSGGVKVKKNHFGSLSELLETPYQITVDRSFEQLKKSLTGWSETVHLISPETFTGTLRPYQEQGVKWLKFLYENDFHGILADDMGLGKTVQVLAFLSLLEPLQPVLIVVPTSLIFNWKNEIERFLKGWKVAIYHGSNRKEMNFQNEIILTSYTTLRLDLPAFKEIDFQAIILDEAQAIKNAHTQTARALIQLRSKFRLSITGTPVENHLGELWSQFRFLMPDLLGDEKAFQSDLQAAEGDTRYLQKIKKKIRPFVLRRRKDEVAQDLPEKIEQIVWVEMLPEQRQIYEDYLSGVRGGLFKKVELDGISKHRMEVLEAILRLRQICCHPLLVTAQSEGPSAASAKFEALMQDLETIVEEGKKVLVYSQFTSMLGLIAQSVRKNKWKFSYLDGTTVNREKVVTEFQEDSTVPIFLISLKAGGIGLNLTSADYVYLYDPWWNDAIENQAIDRAHRIGRKETVVAKRLLSVQSIEEKILKLKEHKRNLIEGLFDDSYTQQNLSEEDFRFLLS